MEYTELGLRKIEHLVWMGMQTNSPNVPMYKTMLHEYLNKLCKQEYGS